MNTQPPKKDGLRNIVIGQKIEPVKLERAKEMRRQMTPA
jgi:hypothetical protein